MFTKRYVMATVVAMLAWSQVVSADTGTIKGVVEWEGKAPKRKKIKTSADKFCHTAHADEPLLSEKLIINDGKIQFCFVYVKSGLPEGKTWDVPGPVVLDQVGCKYVPHVFGAMVGQEIIVRNSDDTAHNINTTPKNNSGFNRGQPKKGMEFVQKFDSPEVMVPFKCDVHPWMSAYVGVMEHPFFATSDENGNFEIKGLPAGEYVLETWQEHKGLPPQQQTVTVTAGQTTEVNFKYSRPKKKKG